MAGKKKIRLSGTGGQGVIKGAVILAEGALIDGRNATQSQVYGPESRGGSTRAEVNISDEEILFPKVESPNIMLCMSPESYDKYAADLEKDGILILDGDIGKGKEIPGVKIYRCPITQMTREALGSELSSNVVALGVMNGVLEMVSHDAMVESLRRNFKPKVVDINIKAYDMGIAAGKAMEPYTV